jgi:hypothetical protein
VKNTFSALFLGFALLGAPALAQEDPSAGDTTAPDAPAPEAGGDTTELPKPADGWWKSLEGGETAKYEVVQMGQSMEMVLTVDSIEGTTLTFTAKMRMPGGMEAPPQTQTVDLNDENALKGDMPADSKVTKVGEETIELAGRSWDCTIYDIEGTNQGVPLKMKMWHCPDLPPVFNNSSVKMEMEVEQGGMKINASMLLVAYGKNLVDEAPTSKPAEPAPSEEPAPQGN